MKKLKAKAEGRENIWVPEKASLIAFIKSRKLKQIHNFIPSGMMILGADHDVESVLKDVEKASRCAVFTDAHANMGHSLALIFGEYEKGDKERLECYDIGKIEREEIEALP